MKVLDALFYFFDGFHVQLLIAELILCMHLKPRIKPIGIALLCGLYCAIPLMVLSFPLHNTIPADSVFNYVYIVMAVISGALLWVCFQFSSQGDLLFYCIPAVLAEHLVYAVNAIRAYFFPLAAGLLNSTLDLLGLLLVLALFYCFFARPIQQNPLHAKVNNRYLLVFSLLTTFLVYGLSVWSRNHEPASITIYLLDALSCIFILIIHFGKLEAGQLEQQNVVMQQLLHMEQEKHRASEESIALINMKCHDLKYQISALRSLNDEERGRSIQELEQAVFIYDVSIKTGNDTLDMLLWERSLHWQDHGITFTCIADGSQLNFIHPTDIYTLFGNAIDNAIESVRAIADKKKRIISLTIASKGKLVTAVISNYYSHDIVLNNGLLETTKPEKEFHGYGLKSIRYITEKYGGTLTIQAEDGIFKLILLIPQPTDGV